MRFPGLATSLRYKLILSTAAILLATLGLTALYVGHVQSRLLSDSLEDRVRALGNFVSLISPSSIYAYDINALDRFIHQITTDPDIRFAMIIAPNGAPLTTVTPPDMDRKAILSIVGQADRDSPLHVARYPIMANGDRLGDVVFGVERSRLRSQVNAYLVNQILIDLAIVSFLVAVIYWVLHVTVLKPVTHLMDGAARVGHGDYSQRVPVSSSDEMGRLSGCFNAMTERIRDEQSALKTLNRELADEIEFRRNAEKHLLEAKQAAEDASRAKSDFLASMSHELRTPLNAILGFAQMMQYDPRQPLTEKQNESVESILTGGNHLLDLVNEVLDLARIEADRLELQLEEVDAGALIGDCVAMTRPLGEGRDIAVINEAAGVPAAIVRTDAMRFKQVLINLLSNAIKFNRDHGAVTVRLDQTETGYARIAVTDTGIGIAEKDFPSVFQMFHRLNVDPMIAREGTGIGLAVTKLLVERMAGRAGFTSTEGVGSTFWVELPLTSNTDILIWTNALRVGVDAIDRDHRTLVMLWGKVNAHDIHELDLDDVIDELLDYTNHHFRREEAIMAVCGVPDREVHAERHRELITELNALVAVWRERRDLASFLAFRDFLKEWWTVHIVKQDTKIAHYAKKHEAEIEIALLRI
ncbi:MAG: HAMP domain-containing protein [Alphaproteobacteria bacterium]|nr:HAMP domain-containing protein [Alphaproteobacteria bacterium]MBF0249908.1 HAMP domain-containing protein [Alphaproteobacteria bacterium]